MFSSTGRGSFRRPGERHLYLYFPIFLVKKIGAMSERVDVG